MSSAIWIWFSLRISQQVSNQSAPNHLTQCRSRSQSSISGSLRPACICWRILICRRTSPPGIDSSEREWRASVDDRNAKAGFPASRGSRTERSELCRLQKHPNNSLHAWFLCLVANLTRRTESAEVVSYLPHRSTIRSDLSLLYSKCQRRTWDSTGTGSNQKQNLEGKLRNLFGLKDLAEIKFDFRTRWVNCRVLFDQVRCNFFDEPIEGFALKFLSDCLLFSQITRINFLILSWTSGVQIVFVFIHPDFSHTLIVYR